MPLFLQIRYIAAVDFKFSFGFNFWHLYYNILSSSWSWMNRRPGWTRKLVVRPGTSCRVSAPVVRWFCRRTSWMKPTCWVTALPSWPTDNCSAAAAPCSSRIFTVRSSAASCVKHVGRGSRRKLHFRPGNCKVSNFRQMELRALKTSILLLNFSKWGILISNFPTRIKYCDRPKYGGLPFCPLPRHRFYLLCAKIVLLTV